MHIIRLAVFLGLLWLLLSGHYSVLMLSFGAFSVAFVIWLTNRMDAVDREQFALLITMDVVVFLGRLIKRVVISNIDVSMRILGFKPVTPGFVELEVPFKDDLTSAMYANAITLTPGSAAITLSETKLLVHTISKEGGDELIAGDMLGIIPRTREKAKRSKLENKGPTT